MSREQRSRRQFTTEQTTAILRRHLVDRGPVSELCNELCYVDGMDRLPPA